MVGVAGFEPTTPCPPDKCANRAALHSDGGLIILFSRGWKPAFSDLSSAEGKYSCNRDHVEDFEAFADLPQGFANLPPLFHRHVFTGRERARLLR